MSRPEHFAERAAGIAALHGSDSERVEAAKHAAECASCASALAEAEAVLSLLDALPPPAPPSPDALARASRSILDELERAERASNAPVPIFGPAVLVAVVAIAFTLVAKKRTHDEPAWTQAAVAALVAVACATVSVRRPRPALGIALVVSACLVGLAASDGSLEAMIGMKCVIMELASASVPYAALAYAAVRRRTAPSAFVYSAIAAAGALAGHAALHVTCPARTGTPHLMIFHLGGVCLAAALGALGARPINVRASRA